MRKEEKIMYILDLYTKIDDYIFIQFFDLDSEAMLDEKIAVLEALKAGKPPADIPNYYKVLENYPPDGEMWD